MKDFLKKKRVGSSTGAILMIIIGLFLVIFPDKTAITVALVIGWILLIAGGVAAVISLMSKPVTEPDNPATVSSSFGAARLTVIIFSLIVAFIGIWMIVAPTSVIGLIPVILGLMLVVDAINNFRLAAECRSYKDSSWFFLIVIGVVSLIFGIICILEGFSVVAFGLRIVGIILIIDGISDIYILYRTSNAQKAYNMNHSEEVTIDVEYEEVIDSKKNS